ncbi:MAG: insulinase family protein [Oscillospiraceae bacterium]|nr:insulinase family protein [Oscillospiraceae bacterium]
MNRTEYASIGEVLYTSTLPNGLQIFVLPKPGFSRRFAVFATNYGGADRRFTLGGQTVDTPAGVAHYLEHKMFDTPEGDALMKLNATGASPNAFTSSSMTAYHFECTEQFEENLKTLLSFVSVPYFTAESVEKERGIIAQEIRMCEDSPDYAIYMDLMELLFTSSPLRDSVAGTVESIQEITPEVLYACHKVFYHPCNMALCVVGDVDPEQVERLALEILPPEASEPPGRDYGPAEGLEPAGLYHERVMAVSAPQFLAGLKLGPFGRGQEELRDRLTGALALRCLCGRSSPVYLRLYAEGLLNDTFDYNIEQAAGESVLSLGGESRDWQAVLDALRGELERIAAEGLDPALFQRQKRATIGSHVRALNNFSALAVVQAEGCFAGYQTLDTTSVLNTITCEDVSNWLKVHMLGRPMAVAVIKPREG